MNCVPTDADQDQDTQKFQSSSQDACCGMRHLASELEISKRRCDRLQRSDVDSVVDLSEVELT
eukprot:2405624-Amphidinium_carterae.1